AAAVGRLGVAGYLPKTRSARELIDALRAVHAGHAYIRAESEGEPRERPGADSADPPTAREMEGLALVAGGLRDKEIARPLSTSERTIQFHLSNLFTKLGSTSRTEMLHHARQQGWIA